MKSKFKCGDKKIKDPFGNTLKSCKGISLHDVKLCKCHLDALNKFCEDGSQNMMNYYKNYSKVFKKCADTSKSSGCKKKDDKNTISVSKHHICNADTNKSCSDNYKDNKNIMPASEHHICDVDANKPSNDNMEDDIDKNESSSDNNEDDIDILPAIEHLIYNIDTNRSSSDNKTDGIDILPPSGHDIYNHHTRSNMANFQIQAIMKLDGRLDFDKLKRAVRLSIDAEPVLGCRFVEDDPPYWKRLDNIDEITFCSLEETDDSDEAVMRFLQSPLNVDNDPKVKVGIIRSEQYDILGVKVNHTCCDGAGTKEYVQLLSDIYSRIDQEGGTFIPEPRIGSRKDRDRLLKESDTASSELRWNPLLETPKAMWAFPWIQRGGDSLRFAVCRLPQGSLESIYQYGKSRGATINDLILTAFYRTMFKVSNPIYGVPMDISSTVDLRHYLPNHKTQAIRNLSGGFITRIERNINESFEGTLSRVMNTTKKIKDWRPGVSNAIGGEYVEKESFTYFHNYFELMSRNFEIAAKCPAYIGNVCFPGLSNLGYISKSLIRFGKNVVTDAYIIPPAIRAPGFLLLASSYNGILTLSIGYFNASISQRNMEGIPNTIKNELMRGCACEN